LKRLVAAAVSAVSVSAAESVVWGLRRT
jgi:hypothetical protein